MENINQPADLLAHGFVVPHAGALVLNKRDGLHHWHIREPYTLKGAPSYSADFFDGAQRHFIDSNRFADVVSFLVRHGALNGEA